MNRQEKRLSRCLSLQIYYAWIISETHPQDILDNMDRAANDKNVICASVYSL